MNVILIYGGRSGEHEISLISCAAVARNISEKHNVKLISIDKDGKWYLQDDAVLSELKKNPSAKLEVNSEQNKIVSLFPGNEKNQIFFANGNFVPCDIVFSVMHGTYGEDGTIQGLFEMCGVPYVGCGVLSSAVTMDKEITKILWKNANLPIVPYFCLTKSDINDSKIYDKKIEQIINDLKFPLFVKPCCAGSSDGASKVQNAKELSFALMEAFSWDNKVLVEKAIDAREVECSVTGNSVTSNPNVDCTILKSYGPGEILPKHTFYDYDAKYNDPNGADLKIPALLDDENLNYIRETAKKAYKVVNASGLSRVDFFIDKKTGDFYLNEINTLPGFTSISMFPKMCDAYGLHFTELIDYLLNEGIEAFKEKQSLCTSR